MPPEPNPLLPCQHQPALKLAPLLQLAGSQHERAAAHLEEPCVRGRRAAPLETFPPADTQLIDSGTFRPISRNPIWMQDNMVPSVRNEG